MGDAALHDLRDVSRDVARVVDRWVRWRAALAHAPESAADEDPFSSARYVSGKATYDALAARATSTSELPLRDGLRRWVYALMQARITRDLDVERARATVAANGRFEGKAPRLVSFRESIRGLVEARSEEEASLWLRAAEAAAPKLASIGRERARRIVEVSHRAGRDESLDVAIDVQHAAMRSAARALLAQTDDIASSSRRGSPCTTILDAVARDAPDGWPARLTGNWLEELFGGLATGLTVRLPKLPHVLGASSFARALYAFGHSLRVAANERGVPFAVAHEAQFIAAHQHGYVIAALTADAEFQRVALHTARHVAMAQARVLARTALLEVRLQAARWLLADARDYASKGAFEELSARIFGQPLAEALAGAWPSPRDDESARLVGLLTSAPFARELVERFDVDWYRNPRAAVELRLRAAMTTGAAPASAEELLAGAAALARAFEDALG